MNKILTIINYARQLSGNAQLDYLKSVSSPLLEEVLEYTYNPNKMYKVDQSKFTKITIHKGLVPRKKKQSFTKDDWKKFTQILDSFADKRAVTDSEVKNVKYFITDFIDEDVQSFLAMVLYKDLRLNLGVKKLQTIFRNFCNSPEVQLAENYDGTVFENGLYSRKFDGKRMYIMDGKAYSRSNKPCKVAPIQHILQQLPFYVKDLVLDGEILYFDRDGHEDFQKGISLTSSDERSVDCENLYFVIFDIIRLDKFKEKCEHIPFNQEYSTLCELLEAKDSVKFGYSILDTLAPNILIARQDETKDKLQYFCDLYGWEGLMYRNAEAPYQFKRTKNLLKMKSMKDGEFELAYLSEGTGKNENKLGALNIIYNDNIVGVGSGFTDEDRELIWRNSEIFLSPIFKNNFSIKVQYFEETTDTNGNPSLRFPVFLCFRDINTKEELTVEQVLKSYRYLEDFEKRMN